MGRRRGRIGGGIVSGDGEDELAALPAATGIMGLEHGGALGGGRGRECEVVGVRAP